MKKLFVLIILVSIICACSQQSGKNDSKIPTEKTGNFGESISESGISNPADVIMKLEQTDSTAAKISGIITSSCEHSGCWMDIALNEQNTIHITFKNDEFAIPLDATGKLAIAEGIVYKEVASIENLRKQAKDEGKTDAEIANIINDQINYSMIANGVIIK